VNERGRRLALLRAAGSDAVRTLSQWRPPERPEPVERPAPRRPDRRVPEPTWGHSDGAATVRRVLQRRSLFPVLEVLGRPRVTGLEYVHAVKPPLILAPNHVSHADAPVVLKALPEWIRERTLVPAAADYFFDRAWLSVLVTLFINAVPFDRQHDIADSVRRCERLLRHGYSIVLFPEGTRSTTGRLRGFKAGVAHLGVQTGAPVIPIYLQGTHALLPRGKALPRPSAVAVHFGKALVAERDDTARTFNQRIETAVVALAEAVRGHSYQDVEAYRPGWREAWASSVAQPSSGAAARAAVAKAARDRSWIEAWRSTTPR
jgi:1-acyl-sn-glycerol-3-phosphate acyltransferase